MGERKVKWMGSRMSKFDKIILDIEKQEKLIALFSLSIIPGFGARIALDHDAGFESIKFALLGFFFGLFLMYTAYKLACLEPGEDVEKYWFFRLVFIFVYFYGSEIAYLYLCDYYASILY